MANNKKPKQIAVLGLGRFGTSVALTLEQLGCQVLAVDKDMEKVDELADKVTHVVQMDITNEKNIKSLGLNNFHAVVLAIGSSVQTSLLAAIMLKDLGVENIIAKARSELHWKALDKLGVNRVVFPEKDMGNKLAHSIMSLNLIEYLEISPDYRIVEVVIQDRFDGKTLREANLRNKHGVNVLAIRRGDNINLAPQADDILRKKDLLVLAGKNIDLDNFCVNC